MRPALQLPRLALLRRRPLPRAALRRSRAPRSSLQRQSPDRSLSRRGKRGPALGLSRAAARAAGPELGAVHLRERFRADRLLRDPVQLAAMSGELDRSGSLRVDAPELEPSAARRNRTLRAAPPEARVPRISLRLRLQARHRGYRRVRSALDRRTRLPMAERALHGPLRMARPHRRRQHAER